MVAWLSAHPLLARALVWCVGVFVAWMINWAIITQNSRPLAIGAWNPPPKGARARSGLDWLPILGWLRQREEAKVRGDRFWLRPFLIELLFPLFMVWLYGWIVTGQTLPSARAAVIYQPELHVQFLSQFVLIALMMVATFIDFDEQMIPDTVTLPGTLLGLLGSACLAGWFLPIPLVTSLVEMHGLSIAPWSPWLDGPWGLAIALGIISLYCFGLVDRVWISRRGWRKAIQYFIAIIFRSPLWIIALAVWIVLCVSTAWAWQSGLVRWQYLLTAYFGLLGAGGYTWLIRVAARQGLGVEALGFGDVTLMAMIGVYLGWQASVLVFFVAPFFAILVFVIRKLVSGDRAGAYGPYLCMAAVCVLIFWDFFRSNYAAPLLELPPSMTWGILCGTLVILWIVLRIYLLIKGSVRGIRHS